MQRKRAHGEEERSLVHYEVKERRNKEKMKDKWKAGEGKKDIMEVGRMEGMVKMTVRRK